MPFAKLRVFFLAENLQRFCVVPGLPGQSRPMNTDRTSDFRATRFRFLPPMSNDNTSAFLATQHDNVGGGGGI